MLDKSVQKYKQKQAYRLYVSVLVGIVTVFFAFE